MNRFLKAAVGSVAVAATMAAALPSANAGDHWRYRHGSRHYHGGHGGGGDALAAGVLGLAAGALIVGLANQQPPAYRVYDRDPAYAPRPHPDRDYPVYSDRVAYDGSLEPWTAEWYQYCSDRYQSFNPHTGTFNGYDGHKHFCIAN